MKNNLTIIILTYNEEKHLSRCLNSFQSIANHIIVIDSFSNDKTEEIAKEYQAAFYQNPFVNQAIQFQWALDNCPIKTEWVMRMDADEYITPELSKEIQVRLHQVDAEITGIILKRQVHFMNKWIKRGGYYPIKLLRIWRNGTGSIEQRWMDEHIKLSHGNTIEFEHDIVDDNLNNLTWWTEKHNKYATREAIDLLNKKYDFFPEDSILGQEKSQQQDQKKRWYKDNIYSKAPLFLRAFLYFIFRYIFLLGFLDGKKGLIWHFLQGFWYRFLVDAKIFQIETMAKKKKCTVKEVLLNEYKIKI